MTLLLRVTGITKRFPGVLALDGVDFEIHAGEVHALVGENGAGKSTLVKVLAGSFPPDAGTISLDGRELTIRSPSHARAAGISIVFQELSLVPQMTVAENLFLGREEAALGLLRRRAMVDRARQALENIGASSIPPLASVRTLSPAARYLVEFAKATLAQFTILLLDEPTASLTSQEAERLFRVVDRFRAEGKGIVYITHRLEELGRVGDRVTVFRDGRKVATLPARDASQEILIKYMTGREVQEVFPPLRGAGGDVVLRARRISTASGLRNVDLDLCAGEILGIGGLIGCGKSELGRALFGLEKVTAGTVELFGQTVPAKALRPDALIPRGVMYFPADRRGEGLVLNRPVIENVTLASLSSFERGGLLQKAAERNAVMRLIERVRLRPAQPSARMAVLSGGNQQKVMLMKGLVRAVRIYLFDEPTQGIDIGAKAEIYQFLHRLAADGAAVLFITSDILELLNTCHRMMILYRGQVSAALMHDDATEERVLRHYFGEFQEAIRERA